MILIELYTFTGIRINVSTILTVSHCTFVEKVDPVDPGLHYGCSLYKEYCVEGAVCVDLTNTTWACECPEGARGDGQKGINKTGCRYRKYDEKPQYTIINDLVYIPNGKLQQQHQRYNETRSQGPAGIRLFIHETCESVFCYFD